MVDVFMEKSEDKAKACVLWFVSDASQSSIAKTLGVHLGEDSGNSVYKRLCEDQAKALRESGSPVFVCFEDSVTQSSMMQWLGPKYHYHVNPGSTLNDRVEEAMYFAFSKGFHFVICVFELLPQLQAMHLQKVLYLLEEYDTALIPSSQGHVGIFGVYRPSFKLSMINGVDFNSEYSQMQIWENIRREGLSVEVLAELLAIKNQFDYEALSLLPKPASSVKVCESETKDDENVAVEEKTSDVQEAMNQDELEVQGEEE